MKKFIRWQILFAVILALTMTFGVLILYSMLENRTRLQTMVNELRQALASAEDNNEVLDLSIDSLASRLTSLSSRITVLEYQKDSLVSSHGGRTSITKPRESDSAIQTAVRGEPVFTIVDGSGNPVGPGGIATDSVAGISLKVEPGYEVTKMEIVLRRGSQGIQAMYLRSGKFNLKSWVAQVEPGNSLVFIITGADEVLPSGQRRPKAFRQVTIKIPLH